CLPPTDECCITQGPVGPRCLSPAMQCAGAAFDCDGPEDCTNGELCCGDPGGSQCSGGGCGGGEGVLCHTLNDCPGNGFVACCGVSATTRARYCSKTACP